MLGEDMITIDNVDVSKLVDMSMNSLSPTQQVCRIQHSNDIQNYLIRSDLDYTIFDKAKELNACQNADPTKTCQTSIGIDGQQYLYIRFPAGTFLFDRTLSLPSGYTGMIIEGDSKSTTILNANNSTFSGIGFYLKSNDDNSTGKYLYLRNLSIIGGYSGYTDYTKKTPNTNTNAARIKWQKAIWAYGANSHAFVSNVNISGFYYGLTAEQFGDAVAENMTVTKSGDGGFFSYFGGRLYVCDSESSYAADRQRSIGFGFVAESLHYQRTDALGIAQCKGGNPNNPDRWTNAAFNQCVINASLNFPENKRSYIFARRVSSHDNLYGGIMANMGAKINIEQSVVFNQYSTTAAQIEKLNVTNLSKPNVYPLGNFGAGHGILARLGSTITANNNKVFNNLIGFNAYWKGSIDATRSDAWNNSYYGFHSVLSSYINATQSSTFGSSQRYGFAVDNTSGIDVDGSISLNSTSIKRFSSTNNFCEQFETPCLHIQRFTPQKYNTTSRMLKINEGATTNGIYYNQATAIQ